MSAPFPQRRIRSVIAVLIALGCAEKGTGPGSGPILEFEVANRLIAGDLGTCALDSAGHTYCWGDNQSYGELGAGSGTGSLAKPTPFLTSVATVVRLSEGNSQHHCGVTGTGDAICWGRGTSGQTGRGVIDSIANAPALVSGAHVWRSIHTGRLHTCGITTDGDAYCWGINARGELGDSSAAVGGPSARFPTPRLVSGGIKWKTLAPGWQHTCGVAEDNKPYCWGSNTYGELGIGKSDSLQHLVPELVGGGRLFVRMATGWRFTCGIATDKHVYCWGLNDTGQLGDGTSFARSSPTSVVGGRNFARISASFAQGTADTPAPVTATQNGYGNACAIEEDGTPWCWGYNGDGRLGDGTTVARFAPTKVAGGIKVTSISTGMAHTCGMRGNAVWCWGTRWSLQLGSPNDFGLPALTPQAVSAPFDKP